MKVTCKDKEITGYVKSLVIEREGETYYAELEYDQHNGYEISFTDTKGDGIDTPDWFDDYDSDAIYNLDELSGNWEYAIGGEVEVA